MKPQMIFKINNLSYNVLVGVGLMEMTNAYSTHRETRMHFQFSSGSLQEDRGVDGKIILVNVKLWAGLNSASVKARKTFMLSVYLNI